MDPTPKWQLGPVFLEDFKLSILLTMEEAVSELVIPEDTKVLLSGFFFWESAHFSEVEER